jgi:hypothetical protein
VYIRRKQKALLEENPMQIFRCIRALVLCLSLFSQVILGEGVAFALQVHPEPEGLYSHQIAHLFFILSMAIFIFWLRKRGLVAESGWRLIQWGCFMFIVWNVGAFIGHAMEARMPEESFVGKGWSRSLVLDTVTSPAIYLFLKMDHLTCVPAIVLLYLGLKSIYRKEAKP